MVKCSIKLIACGYVGACGAALIAKDKREELNKRLPEVTIDAAERFGQEPGLTKSRIGELIPKASYDADLKEVLSGHNRVAEISEGGILAALWDLGEDLGCGMEVDIYNLPIRQETIEVCEVFELNPYKLLSKDCCLIATAEADHICDILKGKELPHAVIGHLTDEAARTFSARGRVSYLNKDNTEEVYKILNK